MLRGYHKRAVSASDLGTVHFFSPKSVPRHLIFLDESGDTGWTFTHPFRAGGSSRYLTIAAVMMPEPVRHLPSRVIRDMYSKYNWKPEREKKGSELNVNQCKYFAEEVIKLLANPLIKVRALTVKKENVQSHIRADSNKLYNYMVKLLVADYAAACDDLTLYPDERSIKLQSGNSLEDYLSIDQWFERKSKVKLLVKPSSSASTIDIRVADFLANIVFRYYQDQVDAGFTSMKAVARIDQTLFF